MEGWQMNLDPGVLAVAALAMVAVGGIAYVFLYPNLSGQRRAEKRQEMFAAPMAVRSAERAANNQISRRDQVAQSLKELESREKARNKITFEMRMAQAGLDWSSRKFIIVSAATALTVAFVLFVVSRSFFIAAAGLFVGGFGLPQWMLSYVRKRRIRRFVDEFPNAMDVIVRGVRAGLPLGDCIRIIASEAAEPVKSEFRYIVEQQTLGVPVGEACSKLVQRIPVSETNFFGIVIAIQQKSGGNLSEALGNLSRVLRERKKMKGKISAMSMEAKASAGIIASLPFIVGILVYLSSPKYIELLFLRNTGKIALLGSAFWMFIGIMSMKKMISFDF
jgi:tight adherence protein B